MTPQIDFVIPWVDEKDPSWQAELRRVRLTEAMDTRESRYRDWGTLRYWFRGVEKYTPWVNRIHLITWGHLPLWLNTKNPKLHVVRHEEYIPEAYLPTFSSHTIELNMHRIEGLSERFVYFNDDTFILSPMKETRFFFRDQPCDSALMNPLYTLDLADKDGDGRIFYIPMNNIQHLNRFYSFRRCVAQHPLKWFNLKYGGFLVRNLLLSVWPRFTGFVDLHLPQAFLKNNFDDAWTEAGDILDKTCREPIRTDYDVNQWFIRYWQLAQGCFHPQRPIKNAVFSIAGDDILLRQSIEKGKRPMICINDSILSMEQMTQKKEKLQASFQIRLPEKSSFEL